MSGEQDDSNKHHAEDPPKGVKRSSEDSKMKASEASWAIINGQLIFGIPCQMHRVHTKMRMQDDGMPATSWLQSTPGRLNIPNTNVREGHIKWIFIISLQVHTANDWEHARLEGGDERKAKFLRLMGAAKVSEDHSVGRVPLRTLSVWVQHEQINLKQDLLILAVTTKYFLVVLM